MSAIVKDHIVHCKTQLTEETFYYTWSIENLLKFYEFGRELSTITGNNDLILHMQPDLEQGTLEFYLTIPNFSSISKRFNGSYLQIFYSVILNTINGKICEIKHKKFSMCRKDKILLYKKSSSYFIENETKYLPNGTLSISFEFHMFASMIFNSVKYSFEPLIPTNANIFGSTEESNLFVTLIIDEKHAFQVNKSLLCSKSKVFKAMFDSGLQESQTNEVHIFDMRHDILEKLLLFLKTGYLSEKPEEININVIHELFITANKYEINDLKLKCEGHLIRTITIENVVEYLKIALLHNGTILQTCAKNFIKLYLQNIVNTPAFIALMKEYPKLMDQIENISLFCQTFCYICKPNVL
ncbi:BTB and MATH domain-containing protein 43-like [Nylanderia fulva]|uniref:BTB and MATH domain-containing protein 43-like n=1 Tax=Nylanderia fulva TaxID=613905 RepID=UPI0010FB8218|nr:BTB and MATH domain-containing protein 43-like [Nylanderia fulva]XP_029157471.1 BTB and MATH domain-containing protein 43-like [Nylanderia fulva]